MAEIYVTVQGDAWDAVAYRLWGNERLFMELIKANPDYMDTVIFPAGVELVIPSRPEDLVKMELPPWRS
ncbi:phage tail protein [Deltaproteobacteria bacterium Smac51]|nr:phage tail protein [Deltaproteobacteria bacterium Smac51]